MIIGLQSSRMYSSMKRCIATHLRFGKITHDFGDAHKRWQSVMSRHIVAPCRKTFQAYSLKIGNFHFLQNTCRIKKQNKKTQVYINKQSTWFEAAVDEPLLWDCRPGQGNASHGGKVTKCSRLSDNLFSEGLSVNSA